MSEESLKSYLADLPLPKDVISQVLGGAKKSRDELIGKAGGELTKLIRKIDLSAEFRRILLENKIKVSAEIDFIPKERVPDVDGKALEASPRKASRRGRP